MYVVSFATTQLVIAEVQLTSLQVMPTQQSVKARRLERQHSLCAGERQTVPSGCVQRGPSTQL